MLNTNQPHRRKNPLTNEWVLVSPHRTQRPWQGQEEEPHTETRPKHDHKCYLCPGNTRANGEVNPHYSGTYVFTNDYSALYPQDKTYSKNESPLFVKEIVSGVSRVICFSEDHSLSMASMSPKQTLKVINLWVDQTHELSGEYTWIQVFENKGAIMGCSNPHPHGQIWASNFIPVEAQKENENQKAYFDKYGSSLLLDYCHQETQLKERVVCENEYWVAVVPYWAVWPFETILLPKHKCSNFTQLNQAQKESLSKILPNLLSRYNHLFNIDFPYSMGWHGSPSASSCEYWQLHAHFYPPLLRSSTIKKFMVGYELLAESQRDITPEYAAEKLRLL